MDQIKQSDGSILYAIGVSTLHITEFGDGLVRHTCRGLVPGEFVPIVTASGELQLKKYGRVVFMVDSYDANVSTQFREGISTWFSAHRETSVAHVLFRSRLVDMAISLVNLFSGKPVLLSHSNIAGWEAAGAREVRGFKRLANAPTAVSA